MRHKIFQRFVMGITTRGSESGGTGLGLSIAKWAATLHGGSIHVVDDSRGVDFEIVLPLHPDVEGTGPVSYTHLHRTRLSVSPFSTPC